MEVKLNDGNSMPVLGLGTANNRDLAEGEFIKVLKEAVDVGYRHFDTAWLYGIQKQIGLGLKEIFEEGKVKREDLFITTKVWNTFHKKESVISNCKTNLDELQLDYVDLFLIHWPMGFKEGTNSLPLDKNGKCLYSDIDYLETWQGLEECLAHGWTKSIGVSNFSVKQLQRLLENCKIKPVCNQIETHPYLVQQELVDFSKEKNIVVVAYSPLGAPYERESFGHVFDKDEVILMKNPVIEAIAKKHQKTNAQILLRWGIQRSTVTIPKTITKSRMLENFDTLSFELETEEMKQITDLDCNWRAYPLDLLQDHPYFPW